MAEYIVLPTELDPLMTRSVSMSTQVLKGPSALSILLSGDAPAIAEREGMLMGFSTSRTYEDRDSENSVVHAVYRFPDAEAAKRAAKDMSDDSLRPVEYGEPMVPYRALSAR
nr:hypothetical protein [Tomitella biformata]